MVSNPTGTGNCHKFGVFLMFTHKFSEHSLITAGDWIVLKDMGLQIQLEMQKLSVDSYNAIFLSHACYKTLGFMWCLCWICFYSSFWPFSNQFWLLPNKSNYHQVLPTLMYDFGTLIISPKLNCYSEYESQCLLKKSLTKPGIFSWVMFRWKVF